MTTYQSTDPYKGTRDFYPEDMAVLQYIFSTWSNTAESFCFERYDASILEPAELYRSKSVENEEIISDQTYTFTDRGEREVTLRPEMTPTVARMVAGRERELSFPLRWYSIPNVFRYERPQRGRLREHWQLNCDIFGSDDIAVEIEIISLAYHLLTDFGAKPESFEIRINDRAWLNEQFTEAGIPKEKHNQLLALLDRKEKIANFEEECIKLLGKTFTSPSHIPEGSRLGQVVEGLKALDITNVRFSPSTVRGFNYYTGVVFEIFDTNPQNARSLIGGGRYDDLTKLFNDTQMSGCGFGMGDVTMRDFLESYGLIPENISHKGPDVMIIPTEQTHILQGEITAHMIRKHGLRVTVDIRDRKLGKKISDAADEHARYVIILGDDEVKSGTYKMKELKTHTESEGSLEDLIKTMKARP